MAECKHDCWKCHWSWLGRCMHGSHYGLDVSIVKDQPQDCDAYISKEDWNKQYIAPMTQERCMELLNAFINNLSVAESNQTVLKHLLYIGFTKDELVRHFNYTKEDVKEAEEGMDEYDDTLVFTG